jgi:hypothetical protein
MRVIRSFFSILILTLATAALTGCGSMVHEDVGKESQKQIKHKTKSGRRVRVAVADVTSKAKISPALRDAVSRYLKDQATTELARYAILEVVDTRDKGGDLLGTFMGKDTEGRVADVEAILHVEVLRIKEGLGATVRVGLVSKQSKYAETQLRVTLELLSGKEKPYRSTKRGESTKGAWGAVAMVDRNKMRKGGEVWDMDGSMAGKACLGALFAGIDDVVDDLAKDMRRMRPDAADRFLRPRTSPRP